MSAALLAQALLGATTAGLGAASLAWLLTQRSTKGSHVVPLPSRSLAIRPWLAAKAGAATLTATAWWLLLGQPITAAFVFAVTLLALRGWEQRRKERRYADLTRALLSAIDLMAQLLLSGQGVRQTLRALAESGPADLRPHLRELVSDLQTTSLENALDRSQRRLAHPVFTLVATALGAGSRSGAQLTPLLQELGRAANQVHVLQSQLRAEQTQGRTGALVIAGLPVALLLAVHAVNPQYLAPYQSATGQMVLGCLLCWIGLGHAWMLRCIRLPELDAPPTRLTASDDQAQRVVALQPR